METAKEAEELLKGITPLYGSGMDSPCDDYWAELNPKDKLFVDAAPRLLRELVEENKNLKKLVSQYRSMQRDKDNG